MSFQLESAMDPDDPFAGQIRTTVADFAEHFWSEVCAQYVGGGS